MKPNLTEINALLGTSYTPEQGSDLAAALTADARFAGSPWVGVSRGAAGSFALHGDNIYRAVTPPIPAVNATGSAEVKPTLVKPNLTEINALLGTSYTPEQGSDLAAALTADARFAGSPWVGVSRGAAGSFALHGDNIYRAVTPPIPAVNATGSGDSTIAGFAHAIAAGAYDVTVLKTVADLAAALKADARFAGIPWVVGSMGAAGSFAFHGDNISRADTPPIPAVTAPGSGDSTIAGFAPAIAAGADAVTVLKTANTRGKLNAMAPQTGHLVIARWDEVYNAVEVTEL